MVYHVDDRDVPRHPRPRTPHALARLAAPQPSRCRGLSRPLPGPANALPTAGEVDAFLRAHPDFLASRPELYRVLAPPVRVHGARLADHMTAMLRAERAHASAMAARADDVLAAGRAAAGLSARVQDAVVALMQADDPLDCIAAELPARLGIDAACLCAEDATAHPGARPLAPGTVERLLGGRAVAFVTGPGDPMLHGEVAALAGAQALLRVPGHHPPALVALVARDPAALDAAQGAGALTFLGRAVAAALRR